MRNLIKNIFFFMKNRKNINNLKNLYKKENNKSHFLSLDEFNNYYH
jgi:hypothetical protein